MIFFSRQKKAWFWSKSDIYSKIDVQINLTGSEREKNYTDLCKSLGFNHTNDEIHIPRAPREEETEILDETSSAGSATLEDTSWARLNWQDVKQVELTWQLNWQDVWEVGRGEGHHTCQGYLIDSIIKRNLEIRDMDKKIVRYLQWCSSIT